MLDDKAFAAEIIDAVRGHVARAVEPLLARIATLEARDMLRGEPGRDGRDGEPGKDGANGRDGADGADGAPGVNGVDGRDGKDGASVTLADVQPLIDAAVERAVAAIPAPKDGRDGVDGKNGIDGADGTDGRDGEPGKDGKDGRDGVDGKDGANGHDGVDGEPGRDGKDGLNGNDASPVTKAILDGAGQLILIRNDGYELVAGPVAGKDGRDGIDGKDGKDGKDGRDGLDGKKGIDGRDGKDGVGMAGAIIDRAGHMAVTLSDGAIRDLGPVVGKDGVNGEPGRDGRDGEPGKDGADGADGLGFDDMTEELADDGRTIIRRYVRGDQVKEFRHALSVVLDRGVYKEGQAYVAGDGVTWGGSFWIAQENTEGKPDSGKGWRLAVKRGRDGKDGAAGSKGDRGDPGKAGRDLTQMGPDGRKWGD